MRDTGDRRDAFLDHLAETLADPEGSELPLLNVAGLLEACPNLSFRLLAGMGGLERRITQTRPRLLGLALRGYLDDLDPGSIQILGVAELRFMREHEHAEEFMEGLFKSNLGAFVVPEMPEHAPDDFLNSRFLHLANAHEIPVIASEKTRTHVEAKLSRVLEKCLSPAIGIHGGLVVYCGLGLLLIGRSGIGKSDCALDLVTDGHQLVADDAVILRRNALGQIIGRSKKMIRHHMDIHGVGIVNVKELFSIYSVLDEHTVDLVLYLQKFDTRAWRHFEKDSHLNILGVDKPMIHLPVSSGRNWSNLIQVAVRNFILKSREGYDAEARLCQDLDESLMMNHKK